MDCVKNDVEEKGGRDIITVDRIDWKNKTGSADPN